LIPVLTDLVNKICNFNSRFNQPIIGKNAFTHKAGIHSKGILKNPVTYEAFSPQIVKRDRKILINKFSGVSALESKLKTLNLELTKKELGLAIAKIKSFETKNDWSKEELYLLVENIKES
jgi:isopropylmalate/homocitrate/citramalate synthase